MEYLGHTHKCFRVRYVTPRPFPSGSAARGFVWALRAIAAHACKFFVFKTACTEIGGGSGRRTDMTFLDFWSTSSALYEPDEGSKDAGTISGLPAQDSLPGLWEAFSALQKRSRNGCVTPQIHLRNTRGAVHTFISMRSAIVVSFMASEQGGVA